jgi:hypothetical protein
MDIKKMARELRREAKHLEQTIRKLRRAADELDPPRTAKPHASRIRKAAVRLQQQRNGDRVTTAARHSWPHRPPRRPGCGCHA